MDYFWGIQKERCNPFDIESIRLLESELVVKRCLECVALFDEKHEQDFVKKLLKESPEKLLLFIQYIDKESVCRQICEQLRLKTPEEFIQNICFIDRYCKKTGQQAENHSAPRPGAFYDKNVGRRVYSAKPLSTSLTSASTAFSSRRSRPSALSTHFCRAVRMSWATASQ